MSLFWAGDAGFPTGRDGFSFFLLAVGTTLPEELASCLQPLQSLCVPQLLAPRTVEVFFFSVPLSQGLPPICEFIFFHDLKPVSIISLEFQRWVSQLYGVVQCMMDQMGNYYSIW
jgi:hypothetical protein